MVNHAMPKMAEDFPGIVSKMWSSDVENPFFWGGGGNYPFGFNDLQKW